MRTTAGAGLGYLGRRRGWSGAGFVSGPSDPQRSIGGAAGAGAEAGSPAAGTTPAKVKEPPLRSAHRVRPRFPLLAGRVALPPDKSTFPDAKPAGKAPCCLFNLPEPTHRGALTPEGPMRERPRRGTGAQGDRGLVVRCGRGCGRARKGFGALHPCRACSQGWASTRQRRHSGRRGGRQPHPIARSTSEPGASPPGRGAAGTGRGSGKPRRTTPLTTATREYGRGPAVELGRPTSR